MLLKMISNKQKRQTLQKCFVERYLAEHFDHPTSEEIYKEAKKEGLHLGLTTVYRVIEGLISEGRVVVIKAGGVVHYDLVRDDHYHFVCDDCGEIIDLRGDQDLLNKLAKRHDFVLISLQGVVVHGLCEECAKKRHLDVIAKGGQHHGKRSKTATDQ